jgi:hypothetical protein
MLRRESQDDGGRVEGAGARERRGVDDVVALSARLRSSCNLAASCGSPTEAYEQRR